MSAVVYSEAGMGVLDPAKVAAAMKLAGEVWPEARPVECAGTIIVPSPPRAWFVLVTVSRGEAKAREQLEDAGYSVYMPREIRMIRHHRSKKLIERSYPLFNRYLFAELPSDLRQWWSIVHPIRELAGALGDEGQPRRLQDGLVEAIIEGERRGAFDHRGKKRDRRRKYALDLYPVGSRVRSTSGPFGGFAGQVEGVDGKGIVKVLLSIFGRGTVVEFDPGQLAPE